MANFKASFAAARKAGKKTFSWNGKSYTTELAKDSPKNAPKPTSRQGADKGSGGRATKAPPKSVKASGKGTSGVTKGGKAGAASTAGMVKTNPGPVTKFVGDVAKKGLAAAVSERTKRNPAPTRSGADGQAKRDMGNLSGPRMPPNKKKK